MEAACHGRFREREEKLVELCPNYESNAMLPLVQVSQGQGEVPTPCVGVFTPTMKKSTEGNFEHNRACSTVAIYNFALNLYYYIMLL
jgi:hypothetical protein